ncbi:MAG: UvrD-helicase domain-containing protein [Candidatus Woesearchaeota archaeon]|jgi:superfamily I DNA/RNA helicase
MKDTDYIIVLKSIKELPFNVGKKLLMDFLRGDDEHPSIINNRLDLLSSFGLINCEKDELENLIDSLLKENYIEYTSVQQNKFWKVLKLTTKGMAELKDPKRTNTTPQKIKEVKTEITPQDIELFKAFEFFLYKYNDDQKKAITSQNKKIICIAGAGSGKTSVLTKRIEFLIKFRTTNPSKILAVTFTRKAKEEMNHRLQNEGILDVRVETFNSFCEKILNLHEKKIYGKPMRVMTYKDKILAVRKALHENEISTDRALKIYFSESQMRSKTPEQLTLSFVNDIFLVLDYIKSKNKNINELKNLKTEDKNSADLLYKVCSHVDSQMKSQGFRDYTDQLMDTIKFFKENKEFIPKFEHILVDEYQDVNCAQIELLNLLNSPSLFCVGDPRQSIFGWRGSDINYILTFSEKYEDSETITLTKNYRSTTHIVDLMNKSIKKLNMLDLESARLGDKEIRLLNFDTEDTEYEFVMQRILHSNLNREHIFVLARTNRQLKDISQIMHQKEIKHILKNDEINKSVDAKKGEVTLATIHAIKGLEAKMVFVVGCTSLNFPCKTSDHPATEIINIEEYNKEEEERRLFYVAISRAMDSLYLTHTGKNHTYFITEEMKKIISPTNLTSNNNNNLFEELKTWRLQKSKLEGVPPYIIMKDNTLQEIANQKPLLIEELHTIKGLGDARIRRFGKEILKIVNQ